MFALVVAAMFLATHSVFLQHIRVHAIFPIQCFARISNSVHFSAIILNSASNVPRTIVSCSKKTRARQLLQEPPDWGIVTNLSLAGHFFEAVWYVFSHKTCSGRGPCNRHFTIKHAPFAKTWTIQMVRLFKWKVARGTPKRQVFTINYAQNAWQKYTQFLAKTRFLEAPKGPTWHLSRILRTWPAQGDYKTREKDACNI